MKLIILKLFVSSLTQIFTSSKDTDMLLKLEIPVKVNT